MNDNMVNDISKNKKKIYLIVSILVMFLLVAGGTYAYITLGINVTNGNYNSVTSCFNIDYDVTNDDGTLPITGTLFPSSGPSGGLGGKVSMKINDSCDVNGLGTLTLNVTDASSVFFQTVAAHCEDSQTLKTMTDYTTSSTCTAQSNGTWVTTGTALKYAVYDTGSVDSSTVPVAVGYVTNSGSITLHSNINLTKTVVNYYIYIWLDGNVSDNSYASLPFNANISASATQIDS